MEHSQRSIQASPIKAIDPKIIPPNLYGVSFSVKQCRSFGLNADDTLKWLIKHAGFRRFRLMSYWDELEPDRGTLDFAALDKQISRIEKSGGIITLCLGARQPRWPENHWPEWAWQLPQDERSAALLSFIEKVVTRYQGRSCIVSYQLENEALLRSFGLRSEIDRKRLRDEYLLVKNLDLSRPVIMSTSNSWGIPLRQPIPDIVGFSYYHTVYNYSKHRYTASGHYAFVHQVRAYLNKLLGQSSFIHELQMEPWGPKNIWEMSTAEQDKSMSTTDITNNLRKARKTGLYPIDLWGGEWWCWRYASGDTTIWQAVRENLL